MDALQDHNDTLRRTFRDHADGLDTDDAAAFYDDPEDFIHEEADSCVPVYNAPLMELCAEPAIFSQDVSEFGQPQDLLQAAQWAVYAYNKEFLYEEYEEWKKEHECTECSGYAHETDADGATVCKDCRDAEAEADAMLHPDKTA